MQMITLIFDEGLPGHHLEYLHHYYMGACARKDQRYVICVPQNEFEKKRDNFEWPDSDNITFEWLEVADINAIERHAGNTLLYGFTCARVIARYAKRCNAQRVLLTDFIFTIPMLLWTMPHKISVRGIIYRIYLYNKLDSLNARIRYILENLCYRLMAHSQIMDKVFMLNDQKSADTLNKRFGTSKFLFLPDPVPEVDRSTLVNLRQLYGIPDRNKVLFHFGGLTQRKGTLEILRAINLSSKQDLAEKTFVFAGRVYEGIHDEFYDLLSISRQKAQILVFDEFCDYGFLYNMCTTCDVILMPYYLSNLSSGVLGYAAVFGKPVIGPSDGLIGHLINEYKMGLALNAIDSQSLSEAFGKEISYSGCGYVQQNEVAEFIKIIMD